MGYFFAIAGKNHSAHSFLFLMKNNYRNTSQAETALEMKDETLWNFGSDTLWFTIVKVIYPTAHYIRAHLLAQCTHTETELMFMKTKANILDKLR